MSPRACSGALARCTGMARRRGQRTLRGNINVYRARARATFRRTRTRAGLRALQVLRCSAAQHEGTSCRQRPPSQRSLHNAPIFRLLLKVAVNGTHQCGFFNFCGALWAPTPLLAGARVRRGRRACARIRALPRAATSVGVQCRAHCACSAQRIRRSRSVLGILAEGAIALSVTLSGGALFAS